MIPSKRFGCNRTFSGLSGNLTATNSKDYAKTARFCMFAEADATLKGIFLPATYTLGLIPIAL
jgi:hypothetical protein